MKNGGESKAKLCKRKEEMTEMQEAKKEEEKE